MANKVVDPKKSAAAKKAAATRKQNQAKEVSGWKKFLNWLKQWWWKLLLIALAIWLVFAFVFPLARIGWQRYNTWLTGINAPAAEAPIVEPTEAPVVEPTEAPVAEAPVVAPLSSQNLACMDAFVERGATATFAAEICANPQPGGQAKRMVAGEVCEGFGTVTYDNQANVWIKENFSEDGKVAFYAYCYPNGADIKDAPFFAGSELSPVTGQPFNVIFPEPAQ